MSYLESDRLAAIEFLEQHSTELVDWTGRDSHITLAEFIHQRRGEQLDRLEKKLDWLHWALESNFNVPTTRPLPREGDTVKFVPAPAWPGDLP